MEQDELERALRDTLSQRVAAARSPLDPAGVAIRRGRRARRLRAVGGVTSAALAIVLVSVGIVQVGTPAPGPGPGVVMLDDSPDAPTLPFGPDPSDADPLALPTGAPPTVELINEHTLIGTGRIDFAVDSPVTAALRTGDGWLLVTGTAARSALWYGTSSGAVRRLLNGVSALVLAPDGRRVAWRFDDRLFMGSLAEGTLGVPEQIRVAGAEPVRFLGAALLLRRAEPAGFRLWWPTADRSPRWQAGPLAVYGPLPDGRQAVGVVRDARDVPCLALLDLGRDLAPTSTACQVRLAPGPAAISPDGRWLLANPAVTVSGDPGTTLSPGAGGGTPDGALLVDLHGAFGSIPSVWPAGPTLRAQPVWTDDRTAVHVDGQGSLDVVSVGKVSDGRAVAQLPLRSAPVVLVGRATGAAAPAGTPAVGG
ncbi:hypothetical protein ACFFWC_16715 [Plantactinospora siamensis]|uniref:LigA protein n=1 Tax=Plantactinospora siamensis TaxID=555372 RepID=A0ABV6NW87_9ACTN